MHRGESENWGADRRLSKFTIGGVWNVNVNYPDNAFDTNTILPIFVVTRLIREEHVLFQGSSRGGLLTWWEGGELHVSKVIWYLRHDEGATEFGVSLLFLLVQRAWRVT